MEFSGVLYGACKEFSGNSWGFGANAGFSRKIWDSGGLERLGVSRGFVQIASTSAHMSGCRTAWSTSCGA